MASDSLETGKLEPNLLKQIVLGHLGTKDARVLLGPNIGEDASVIDFGQKALVVHSDPITGAVENLGWLAVNVCANDIATRGVRPLWLLIVILLPQNTTRKQLKTLTSQIDGAAKKLGVAVVGGHSEITPSVNQPIVITTAIGETSKGKFVRTGGAKPGDLIIVTKGAAIEGTAILASELAKQLQSKIGMKTLENAKRFIKMTSVVEDALTAIEAGEVHAMHDATEGGIASGLQEIAWASKTGLIAHEEKIPISKETTAICKALNINPLKTISSGALIICADPENADKIMTALEKKGIKASIVGKIIDDEDKVYLVRKNGTKLDLTKPVKEDLWKALKRPV
ncbi:MAG TPA: AIR synthase family protein [Candidatus Bathyarchaeia archaeon]|nr:AIR synthase family protein [Candidatus Bathyarchaeia archaeon]